MDSNDEEMLDVDLLIQELTETKQAIARFPESAVLVFRISDEQSFTNLELAVDAIQSSPGIPAKEFLPTSQWEVKSLNQAWSSDSVIGGFEDAALVLEKCCRISTRVGCLVFTQLSIPCGMGCVYALIEAFGHEIIGDSAI